MQIINVLLENPISNV